MRRILQRGVVALAVVTICVLFAGNSYAQCGSSLIGKLKPQSFSDDDHNDGIVGFWRITMTSKGNNVAPLFIPDGALIDHAFAQWHSDGTEIMNSNRKPSTGSFCLGVWKKVGRDHYRLNHFALGFDDGVTLAYNNIREDVVLSNDGDSFSGSFVIAIYDANGNPGPVIKGDITGKRVKVNTTVGDIL